VYSGWRKKRCSSLYLVTNPTHDLVCVCVKTQGQFGKCCERNLNWFTRPSVVGASEKEGEKEGDRKEKMNYYNFLFHFNTSLL